jgi:SAM-dependent methyltransferase
MSATPSNEPATANRLATALWRLYNRPPRPALWESGGNLPWNDPAFGARMLREHLDQSHGAASRTDGERAWQLPWLWEKLALNEGSRVLDLTCGPGLYAVPLAQRGCRVTGVDFNPASIAYARELAGVTGVGERCVFVETDVRDWTPDVGGYDAALILYGQLAVFPPAEADAILEAVSRALTPTGRLVVELLEPTRVDKSASTWWHTSDKGLWGDAPYLHLGERFWDEMAQTSIERFHVLHLENGDLEEIVLCDRVYRPEEMSVMLQEAGFATVQYYPGWEGGPLYDAGEWIAYVAKKSG